MRQPVFRFLRYVGVGVSTFLFDLGLLYGAVHFAGISYLIATPASFLIAVSVNYALSRVVVFSQTERSWHHGYAYFAVAAISGAILTTALVASLVSILGLQYLVARCIAAGFIGIGNYLFNLHLTFEVAGKH